MLCRQVKRGSLVCHFLLLQAPQYSPGSLCGKTHHHHGCLCHLPTGMCLPSFCKYHHRIWARHPHFSKTWT